MSDEIESGPLPPSYREVIEEKESDVIPPSLLSVDGQSITTQASQDEPAAIAYQLNRGISSLSHATSEVTFERLVVPQNDSDEKAVASASRRKRHIYNLKYIHRAPGGLEGVPSDSPHYYVEAVSSRTKLGSLGIKKSTLRKQWKAIPLDMSGKNSSYKLPQFIKSADAAFTLSIKDDQFIWTDAQGTTVAEEALGDGEQPAPNLQVKVAMPRNYLDLLAALWCCHVWQQSADGQGQVQSRLDSGT
ncbi:hypothetical protein NLG97_g10547 [Lecanicillium saksenae]|uniref:Uncharacterized protein n=1 Tax=Lecanicillium saksenae TaxID=468837 RepID=A0ACC1QCW4_9HYPO|nr:hypothetical protein NLG97_g10547 [Lecanicillium saksenae]